MQPVEFYHLNIFFQGIILWTLPAFPLRARKLHTKLILHNLITLPCYFETPIFVTFLE